MKTTWICILSALVLCVMLCGCQVEITSPSSTNSSKEPTTASTVTTTTTVAPDADVPLTLLENGYAYSLLSAEQQENYEEIVDLLYKKRGYNTKAGEENGLTISLKHHLYSQEEVEELFYAIYDDHPEFFYLRLQYSWLQIGKAYTRLSFYYIWDAEERATKAVEAEAAVSSLITQAQGLSDVDAELLFHDALITRNDYNTAAAEESAAQTEAYFVASSSYAALCNGAPICGGYSRAFHWLLSRFGIQNTALINENHAWSMVWLDGQPYHVDVTWDDPVGGGAERHTFFNVTDKEARATREVPEQVREIPTATATAYNYHQMRGQVLESVYDDRLDECIRAQIENGAEQVELKFDPADYEEAIDRLFDGQLFFEAVYELEDDTLRDRWYAQISYRGEEEIGDMMIYPLE